MKIKEILKIERENSDSIILHKEGMFWRAYEKSAYLFTSFVKEFKITKRYFKNVNSEVVYLGFPQNSLNDILKIVGNKTVNEQEKTITVEGFDCDIEKFNLWKTEIRIQEKSISKSTEIEKQILNFPIAHKTPVECQQFLIELQNKIPTS